MKVSSTVTITLKRKKMLEARDHLGNVFPSLKAMCDTYGVSENTFHQRDGRGYTLKECLLGKRWTDHKGKEYDSFKEMCEAYGKSAPTVRARLKKGFLLSVALETPLGLKE